MQKSKLILLICLVIGAGLSYANGFDKRMFGLEGSLTMNDTGPFISGSEDDDLTYGGSIGVCYKLINRYGWFFEPTLGFSMGDYEFHNDDAVFKTSLAAIELSIKFGHDFNLDFLDMTLSPLICVKPVFAMAGHLDLDGVKYHWNPFNIAAGFGFGLLFYQKFGLNIRGDFNLLKSIRNLPKSPGITNHNGTVNLTLKYYF